MTPYESMNKLLSKDDTVSNNSPLYQLNMHIFGSSHFKSVNLKCVWMGLPFTYRWLYTYFPIFWIEFVSKQSRPSVSPSTDLKFRSSLSVNCHDGRHQFILWSVDGDIPTVVTVYWQTLFNLWSVLSVSMIAHYHVVWLQSNVSILVGCGGWMVFMQNYRKRHHNWLMWLPSQYSECQIVASLTVQRLINIVI